MGGASPLRARGVSRVSGARVSERSHGVSQATFAPLTPTSARTAPARASRRTSARTSHRYRDTGILRASMNHTNCTNLHVLALNFIFIFFSFFSCKRCTLLHIGVMNTTDTTGKGSETPVKFRTTSAYVSGAIVGTMWMPSCKGALQYSSDARSKNERITGGRVALRDLLESMLREDGGDFQDSQFSADTVLRIKRVAVNGNYCKVHIYEREISALPDCADLVNTEIYSNDFNTED